MSIIRLPGNPVLLYPRDGQERPDREARPKPRPVLFTSAGLIDRLVTIGDIAPHAPLSFLLVQAEGVTRDELTNRGSALMASLAARLLSLTKATDTVGWFGEGAFGVVLQGNGATAAGAVAARLTHHLGALAELIEPGASIRVSAATGTGVHARMLPAAAGTTLGDCG